MAKNKNNAPKKAQAPTAPAAPEVEEVKVEEVKHTVKDEPKILDTKKVKGLSQDSKVLYADLMQRRYIEHPANGVRYTEEFLNGVNMLIDTTIMSVAVDEVVSGESSLALLIKKAPDAYNRLSAIASGMGVNLPALNLLPAPTEDQLKNAGIEAPAKDLAVVTIEKKNISKETQAIVKKELKIQEQNVETDPTKVKDAASAVKSAEYIMTSRKGSVFDNLIAAISFYRSWLLIQSKSLEKEEDRKKEQERIEALSEKDILLELSELIGACPFIMRGLGHYMHTITATSKSPVSAFCIFRNVTKNKTTGIPNINDSTIADLVSVIIVWAAKNKIAEQKKNIEALSGDKKSNKEAIDQANTNIEYFNNVIESVLCPDFSTADSLIEKYDANDDQARKTFKAICDSYYADIDVRTVNQAQLKKNVQQYAGVILNLFAAPGSQSIAYKESNITELTPVVTEKTEDSSKK